MFATFENWQSTRQTPSIHHTISAVAYHIDACDLKLKQITFRKGLGYECLQIRPDNQMTTGSRAVRTRLDMSAIVMSKITCNESRGIHAVNGMAIKAFRCVNPRQVVISAGQLVYRLPGNGACSLMLGYHEANFNYSTEYVL